MYGLTSVSKEEIGRAVLINCQDKKVGTRGGALEVVLLLDCKTSLGSPACPWSQAASPMNPSTR